MLEAKEPIIKSMAQSALEETKEIKENVIHNVSCDLHRWYGMPNEVCPLCKKLLNKNP